jgi:3-isopropylmalate dehydrogenase
MGEDKANPLAAVLCASLMLDYLGDKLDEAALTDAGQLIEDAVCRGFADRRIAPIEFGGGMGTKAVAREVVALIGERESRDFQGRG